jgi:hypothetical protein
MLDDDVPCGDPLARLSLPSVPVFGRAKMRTNMRGDANLNCFRRPIPLIRGSHLSFQYDFFPYDAIFADFVERLQDDEAFTIGSENHVD